MTTASPHDDQSKLDAIIASYLEALERGEVVDRELFLQQHPDFAEELRAFFVDFDRLQLTKMQPNREPEVTFVPQNEPKPGAIISDRYKLRENIGEGGMGSVWVAEQLQPVKRRVAIKLIKAGMDSKQVLARFEAERQALALMDHPNIAKVFDGGMTEQGRPYFVMEYVKGVPFTEYCDKARLSLKERLELFIPVCQAVQHAHHKGIVHRDLKPSNILICLYDGNPVPKVIDFGLAKAMHQQLTEHSIYTAHGIMVGTPLYMSPEQAEHNNLDVDTRTDVYSLGVVLYESLTGSTPLERDQIRQAAYAEVVRLIKEVEAPRPSTRLSGSLSLPNIAAQRNIDPKHLQRALVGDLDWIVMKALEKERSRRYETANGLSKDVERFLNNEAVEACPPSGWYRASKYIRRHKAQMAAGAFVLFAVVVAAIGFAWGWKRSSDATATIERSLVEVTRERDAKEKALSSKSEALRAKEAALLAEAKQRRIAEQARADSEQNAYAFGLQSAYGALQNGEIDAAKATLTSLPERLRKWEWNWLLAESEPYLGVVEIGSEDEFVAFSRKGDYAVVAEKSKPNGPFRVINSVDGHIIDTVQMPPVSEVMAISVSDGAKRCAILAVNQTMPDEDLTSTVYVWDTQAQKMIWSRPSGTSQEAFFSTGIGFSITDDGTAVFVRGNNVDSSDRKADSWNASWILYPDKNQREIVLLEPMATLSPNGRYLIGTESSKKNSCWRDLQSASPEIDIPFGENIEVVLPLDYHFPDRSQFVTESVVALRTQNEGHGYLLFDLAERRIVHSTKFFGLARWGSGGQVGVQLKSNRLCYFLNNDQDDSVFHGYVPNGVTDLRVDEIQNHLFAIESHRIYRFPMFTEQEFRQRQFEPDLIVQNALFNAARGEIRDEDTLSLKYVVAPNIFEASVLTRSRIEEPEVAVCFLNDNGEIVTFDCKKLQEIRRSRLPELQNKGIRTISMSRDGSTMAMLCWRSHNFMSVDNSNGQVSKNIWESDGILTVLDPKTTKVLLRKEGLQETEIVFLDQSKALLHNQAQQLLQLDLSTGNTSVCKEFGLCSAATVSSSGSLLATVLNNQVSIWRLSDRTLVTQFSIPQSSSSLIGFAQNDSRLIVGGHGRSVSICDPSNDSVLLMIGDSRADLFVPFVPSDGNSMLLGQRWCSAIPFRKRWKLWQETIREEFSSEEVASARQYLIGHLYNLPRIDSQSPYGAVKQLVLSDNTVNPIRKSHALQMLDAARRELYGDEFQNLLQPAGFALELLIKKCREYSDNPGKWLYADVLAGYAVHVEPSVSDLNEAAWHIAVRANASEDELSKALSWAERAVEREADDDNLNTLGIVQYRSRKYVECIDSLSRAEKIRTADSGSSSDYASNLIFIAMATYQLGDHDGGRRLLSDVNSRVDETTLEMTAEDKAFMAEAEQLMTNITPP